jgi:ribonucleoside-diphosphate reductase alpha chain
MDDYSKFIHKSRYARWREEEGRRETWPETVGRYIDFFRSKWPPIPGKDDAFAPLYSGILSLDVMPSMRALMTAGPALEETQVAGYNCCFVAVNEPTVFDEIMYVLMCGTGVGFSVENQFVSKLPIVPKDLQDAADQIIVFEDSRIGWAGGFREYVSSLYAGRVPRWNLSKLRAAGVRLKTFGGRASGPEPLADLLVFTRDLFLGARGRRLTTLECHDLVCKIADIVVVGGVRRSALISLSDLEDTSIQYAKHGRWWENHPHRALANNSAVYTSKPGTGTYMREMLALYDSQSGERGIFNREAAQSKAALMGRDASSVVGTNPCGEILLRSKQFCNLSEVVLRPGDNLETVKAKVTVATILGTLQASLTDFKYLSPEWKKNTEEERLLGVSLTGVMDWWPSVGKERAIQILQQARRTTVEVNAIVAQAIGIPASVSITCVKPSGTVSQLVDSSSGIHARYAPYYIRTVRADNNDPMCKFLKDQGVPNEPDVTKPKHTTVFSFPKRSPDGALCTKDMTAIDQLEMWKVLADEWCDHNPSTTIQVKEDEWVGVFSWMYNEWDSICGIALLPYSEHTYQQAPYQEITREEYEKMVSEMPKIDWDKLREYETEDTTSGSQELACSSGSCEIVDIN